MGPNGMPEEDPEKYFTANQEMVPAKHLPTGFAYHGTSMAVWRLILDRGLKAGGEGRTERMRNHLAPLPITSEDLIPGMRQTSDVYIQYDLARFQEDLRTLCPGILVS